jgi:vacuolar-type H+-ATPase subunit H
MALEEISRLKRAEEEALEIIARAEKEAEDILSGAAESADALITRAVAEARKECDARRKSALAQAERVGREIIQKAVSDAEYLSKKAKEREGAAIRCIVQIVTGESYVLSGQDV